MKTAQLRTVGLFAMFLLLAFAASAQGEKLNGIGLEQDVQRAWVDAAGGDEPLTGRSLLQEGNSKGTGNGVCTGTIYMVKAGDTLSALANKAMEIAAKCSVQKIAQANRIKDVNRITIGERLCLPKGCAQPK